MMSEGVKRSSVVRRLWFDEMQQQQEEFEPSAPPLEEAQEETEIASEWREAEVPGPKRRRRTERSIRGGKATRRSERIAARRCRERWSPSHMDWGKIRRRTEESDFCWEETSDSLGGCNLAAEEGGVCNPVCEEGNMSEIEE
ncbi:uncharacterized protein LOC117642113 isoform X2 [Thrips palmi]|uniref:Uncharacterized protein LOC117642113 isoform X2 n=1 Tax=Thrips palmi TaxID=161013 RepID=A0A6P8YP34_THRPL|nr:uncharacterized protein LOC117642113 isoform X2 [Thrips palmi]